MKVITYVRIDMETLELLEEHSFEYQGPLALCDDGESEGEGEGDPSPGEPGGGLGGLAGAQSGEGGEIGEEGDTSTEGGGPSMTDLAGSETGLTDREMGLSDLEGTSWGKVALAAMIGLFTGFATPAPGGAAVGAGTFGAAELADQGKLGAVASALGFGGFEGPGPAQAPDTSDTGGATEGGEGGGTGAPQGVAGAGGSTTTETAGLLGPEIPGDELDEDEETLGRGRRATQTLLTGGRGLLSPARTRRRTLLAA